MRKSIANLLEVNSFYIAIVLTFAIVYLSIITIKLEIPRVKFWDFDKILHLIAYSSLSFSWFLSMRLRHQKTFKIMLIAAAIFIYGIIIEIVQEKYTLNREADKLDVLANAVGIALGFGFFTIWIYKRKLEK